MNILVGSCSSAACVLRLREDCADELAVHPASEECGDRFFDDSRAPLVTRYSTRLDSEPSFSRCYVIVEGCDSGGIGNCGVCRFENRLGQRCGETGGVVRGVFGAEPAVNRQLLSENALDLPTAERLVLLLLLQATAADRSTLDTALRSLISRCFYPGFFQIYFNEYI